MDRQLDNESRIKKSIFERGRNKAITAGVAFAVGAGALAGCGPDASAEGPHTTTPSQTEAPVDVPTTNPSPEVTVSSEPTVTPSETATESPAQEGEIEISVEALKIPAGLDAIEFQQMVETRKWDMIEQIAESGYDDAALEFVNNGGSIAEFDEEQSEKYAEIYADATFIPQWRDEPSLVEAYERFKSGFISYQNSYYLAGTLGAEFEFDNEVVDTEVLEELSNGRVLRSTIVAHTNDHEIWPDDDSIDGEVTQYDVLTRTGDDGYEYVARYAPYVG